LEESIKQKVTNYDHLCKMTIHGMLHLLGYDHNTEKQFKQMNKFENLIFDNIKHLS
jgi:probable rRNA maturation factor